MALAERQADGSTWRVFSGNEIGTLLGCWQWEMFQKAHPQGKAAVVCSTVSSKMLRAVAQAEGFEFHETLTGRLALTLLVLGGGWHEGTAGSSLLNLSESLRGVCIVLPAHLISGPRCVWPDIGFKWLGYRAQELSAKGIHCLLAYEEAIGYVYILHRHSEKKR